MGVHVKLPSVGGDHDLTDVHYEECIMRTHSRTPLTAAYVVVMLAMLLGVTTSSALAGATPAAGRQPDGRIRLQKISYELFPTETYSRTWIGSNVYNAMANGQAAREAWYDTTPGWQRWIFGVSVQNDGTSSDRIRVQATGTALEGWTVKYFHGTTNITSAVVGGTFTTPLLGPGEEHLIKVKVTRDADHFDMGNLRRLISLTSVGNSNKSDAVRLVMSHVTCGC